MYTMAIKCTRKCYKSIKILLSIVVFIFFIQLYIFLKYFPPENNPLPDRETLRYYNSEHNILYRSKDDSEVSARKLQDINSDDEDLISKNLNNKLLHENESNNLKYKLSLNKEELDFTPVCHVVSKEAISAIHRAKTQRCKEIIINTTCLVQSGSFYAENLPSSCASGGLVTGKQLGCYHDEKKLRLLSSHYGNYRNTNSPQHCIDVCLQAGFPYAGVQYASECFCGEDTPSTTQKIADTSCNMKCPGDPKELCGGYFTMNVYETGVSKFNANVPNLIPENSSDSVRIVFLLTLNGRALRQVRRLINALYNTKHYFYIHVDARQDYLHRELLPLQKQFSNVKIAHKRFSTIWGGASLLEMLLSAMSDLFALQWTWDFVINLSESDFPIKPLKQLETFLTANKGRNFVKSHGREVQRFIKKQGLDKTFIECDAHMWRIGDRKLPRGIVIDGGSDWVALSPDFVSYVVGEQDNLLAGLHTIFKHTLLPAESFFHTVLRNSVFCSTYVDNNLHVTNWKRKLGCKCQYKHVVDWCGCSPNDFRLDDWSRIQSTRDRQLFFARKFEPVINQAIIARVEQWLGIDDHYDLPNSESYWQSIYHMNDSNPPVDDALLTHTTSITRLNAKILTQERCKIVPGEVIEISSYHYEDMYKGNLIKHNVEVHSYESVLIETWYKPKRHLELNRYSRFYDNIKIFLVSSDYDQKEQTFRNFANILGPLSEPSVLYQFILAPDQTTVTNNFTIFWLDPADNIADINDLQIDESNLTSYIKPNLQTPLLPGIWKVAMFDNGMIVAQTKFLITPLQYLSGNKIVDHEITFVNAGSMSSYKDYSARYRDITDLTISESHRESARMLVQSNMKRFGSDLVEWIDNLVHQFYDVLGSCVHYKNEDLYNTVLSCGRHNFEICKLTKWSSFAPDPKGHIGKLNKVTGSLDRR